jgi:uncharacterized alkaline shock family protein YloU
LALVERVELARHLAAAAATVPGVAELTAGRSGAVTEYGPGGSVSGVALEGGAQTLRATVSVAARYAPDLDLPRLATAIREAVQSAADEHQPQTVEGVDVVVADLVFEEEALP